MSVLLLVLPLSLLVSTLFVVAFMASVRRGEFDDLETPARRMLLDDPPDKAAINSNPNPKQVR